MIAAGGWALALLLGLALLRIRRRLELVARAEHEVRGPATVLCLVVGGMRRDPAARRHARTLELELLRLRAALRDLSAARAGRRALTRREPVALEPLLESSAAAWRAALRREERPVRVHWRGRPALARVDPGRLAQALGNLMANAAEHGTGPVEVLGGPAPEGVRLEVRSGVPRPHGVPPERDGRGRGLRIAATAAAATGARLRLHSQGGATVAALELPAYGERGEATRGGQPPLAA